jgi:hypothetical protein
VQHVKCGSSMADVVCWAAEGAKAVLVRSAIGQERAIRANLPALRAAYALKVHCVYYIGEEARSHAYADRSPEQPSAGATCRGEKDIFSQK